MDYFESEEFREILKSYEDAKRQSRPCYLDSDDFIDVAEYYVRHQDFNRGLTVTEDALALHPDDMALRGMNVSALINLGRIDDASKALLQLDPDENYDYHYFQAQILLASDGNLKEIHRLFHLWLDMEIDDMKEELHGKIDEERLHEDYMHILASLSELCDDDNVSDEISGYLADFRTNCKEKGRYECDFEIAHICHEEGMIEDEINLYKDYLEEDPYLDGGWTYLASLQHMEGMMQDAIESADFALAINPDDTYTILLRGHSYFVLDNYLAALHDYQKYERLSGASDNAHIIGRCYIMLNQLQEGYKRLEQACVLTSAKTEESAESKSNTWAFIAQSFMEGGFMHEALMSIDKALELLPDYTEYILLKANIFLKQKDWDEAKYWFLKSLETTERRVMVELCIGGDYVYEERFEDAMEFFKMATKERKDPMRVRAYAYLAFLYYRIKDKRNFRRTLKIACENTPETIYAFWEDELKDVSRSDYYEVLKNLI